VSSWLNSFRQRQWTLGIGAAALVCAIAPVWANDVWQQATVDHQQALRETWVSAHASRKVWSITNGTTWTPSSDHAREGIRLRLIGGLNGYRYTTRQFDPTTPNGRVMEHTALRQTLEAMAGYQWRLGPWTLKAFTGIHGRRSLLETQDRETGNGFKARELALSAKVTGEVWLHISYTAWASADLSFTGLEQAYSGRLRAGWRPHTAWSIGPEVTVSGTLAGVWPSTSQRVGAFVRYDDGMHELSASAGYDWSSHQTAAPYASIQYLYRY
jgi:hypothetical protein